MPTRFKDKNMETVISRFLRSKMVEEGITYDDLSLKLKSVGVIQNPSTLRTKVSEGSMGAPLFIHILSALNETELSIDSMMKKYQKLSMQD